MADKITITAPFSQDSRSLGRIGRVGENISRQIVFDCTSVLTGRPNANIVCVIQRPGDKQPYAAQLVRDGSTSNYKLVLTSTEVAASGSVRFELRMVDGDEILKAAVYSGTVETSMSGLTDKPGEPLSDALNRLETAIAEVGKYADLKQQLDDVSAAGLSAADATENQVPTADGAGGWAWKAQQGGGTVAVDTTLTQEGKAADAKAVGDAVNEIETNMITAEEPTASEDVQSAVESILKSIEDKGNGLLALLQKKGDEILDASAQTGGNTDVVYCWGDSLTEGVGGDVATQESIQRFIVSAYPDVVARTYPCVNLGCRGETIQTIMARQGSDPMVVGGFTIPASADENVIVGYLRGRYYDSNHLGLATQSGDVAQPLKETEAGVNPCVIAGVEGILYRDYTADSDGRYAYRFHRLKDGEATVVPSNTQIETYAMRNYRNGVAVIWMGANGAVNSHTAYIQKLKDMITYGNYKNYIVVIAREYIKQWVFEDTNSIAKALTDENGTCHLLYLPDELVRRGYTLAGVAASANVPDTSAWTTTDAIKKNAPLLMYSSGGNTEDKFDTLHFSAYGYKAIGKMVVEKLGQLLATQSSSGDDSKPTDVGYVKDGEDDFGAYAFKLTRAKTGTGSIFNTGYKPHDVEKNWTIACRFADNMVTTTEAGTLGCIFESRKHFSGAESKKDTVAYLRRTTNTDGSYSYSLGGGFGAFSFHPEQSSGYVAPTDGYHDAIIRKEGGLYTFWMDGGKAYNSALDYTIPADHYTDEPLYLFGRVENGNTYQIMTGEIKDFRIYETALNDAQISTLCQAMKG